jgi:hypothetical protein
MGSENVYLRNYYIRLVQSHNGLNLANFTKRLKVESTHRRRKSTYHGSYRLLDTYKTLRMNHQAL